MMRFFLLFLCLLAPAKAQDVATRTLKAVEAFYHANNVSKMSIIMQKDGITRASKGFGDIDPDAPIALASLSKAITAACLTNLVEQGKTSLQTPVSVVLKRFYDINNVNINPQFEKITLAQLVTHRAGLGRYSHRQNKTAPASSDEAVKNILATPLKNEGDYHYSNAGYILLGAIIEEISGKKYESYCYDTILAPFGINAQIDPQYIGLGSSGGWKMRGEDYLKFFTAMAKGKFSASEEIKTFEREMSKKSTSYYGLGARTSFSKEGKNTSHWGEFDNNTRSLNTYALYNSQGYAWFVSFSPVIAQKKRAEFVQLLLTQLDTP